MVTLSILLNLLLVSPPVMELDSIEVENLYKKMVLYDDCMKRDSINNKKIIYLTKINKDLEDLNHHQEFLLDKMREESKEKEKLYNKKIKTNKWAGFGTGIGCGVLISLIFLLI